jgi:hypothetical protein
MTMRHLLFTALALSLTLRPTSCLRGLNYTRSSSLSSPTSSNSSNSSHFIVIIVRHGERFPDTSITKLSPDGQNRAEYLARCMSTGNHTSALSFGAPTIVASPSVRPGKSTRPRDTMSPLAKALNLTVDQSVDKSDYKGFAQLVHRSATPGGTLVAAWQHENIPFLIKALGAKHNQDEFSTLRWPKSCDSASWREPSYIEPSDSCYDAIWRVRLKRTRSGKWKAGAVVFMHEGYGGKASSPCAQDLAPSMRWNNE